ncbi:MAG: ATP-binding cassette domain-containing protein [Granulosicoccus sp.]
MNIASSRVVMPFVLCALFLVVLAGILTASNGYTHFIFTLVSLSTLVGVGLNILYGLTGLISFGHIAFYAIGSYSCALLMLQGVNFFLALFCSAVLSGFLGLVFAVPAVRVKGAFLAMVTIAFAFVIEHTLVEWRSLTGGQNGLSGFPSISLGFYEFNDQSLAILASGIAFLALLAYFHLEKSGWGLAMKGVRDAEIASASLGYQPDRIKTIAFGVSALLTGLAGAIYTPLIMFIAPSNFPFSQSILFLFSVILGGIATTLGPLFGAIVTVMLPEFLSGLAQYRLLFFGGLMLAVLLIAPSGITGLLSHLIPKGQRHFEEPAISTATAWLKLSVMPQALATSGLSISFGGVKAVKHVSFKASPGKVLSIIGPNGAGKTTLLNIVSGFYKPDTGSVMINDVDIASKAAFEASRAGIARTYQTTRLYEKMSVLENVLSGLQNGRLGNPFARLDTPEQTALVIALLRFSGYTGEPDLLAGNLAHVDRRFVEIARALATAPSVILLDEPAAGLMRTDKNELSKTIKMISDIGIAVVLVEHDMTLVMDISDEVVVLDGGKAIATGSPDKIRKDEGVIAAYLGSEGFSAPGRSELYKPSSQPLLATKQLTAGYGAASVLKQVNLEVYKGELVAILGANGAGKSTLMSALSGLIHSESGSISLADEAIHHFAPHQIVSKGLILVPEGRQVFPELTVLQNIRLGAYKRTDVIDSNEIVQLIARFPRLRNRLTSQAGFLSGGEQQMLAIARGLMGKPAVLLLDEPSLGLSPSMISELYLILAKLRDEGVTILLVDQMAQMALDIADRAYVLEQGRIVAEGTSAVIRNNNVLADAYLGASHSNDIGSVESAAI